MRNFLLIIPLICSLLLLHVSVSESWVAVAFYYNKAHPGKCFYNDAVILTPGETIKHPDNCAEITCSSGENGLAQITGCGAVAPPPACEWDDYVDVNAPYPQCCVRKVNCANAENLTAALVYQQHVSELFGGSLTGTNIDAAGADDDDDDDININNNSNNNNLDGDQNVPTAAERIGGGRHEAAATAAHVTLLDTNKI